MNNILLSGSEAENVRLLKFEYVRYREKFACNVGMEEAIDTLFVPYYRALEARSIDTRIQRNQRPLFLSTVTYVASIYVYIYI